MACDIPTNTKNKGTKKGGKKNWFFKVEVFKRETIVITVYVYMYMYVEGERGGENVIRSHSFPSVRLSLLSLCNKNGNLMG